LIGIKEPYPEVVTVALLYDETIVPDESGAFPWLGGVEVMKDDRVSAAASIGTSVFGPVHGLPSDVSVNTPGYQAFVTKDIVNQVHALDMTVVPYTGDYEVTIDKLIDDGVDGLISDYPERVMWVARQKGLSTRKARSPSRPNCLVKASA
jgi:glycerophosphoryl diester phosphodiesterase